MEQQSAKKKCPFCSEFIQNDATKCRYCGEWLKNGKLLQKKSSINPIAVTFTLWILTISYFISSIAINPNGTTTQSPWGSILLIIVLIGMSSYSFNALLIIKDFFDNKKRKTATIFGFLTILFTIGFFIGLFTLSNTFAKPNNLINTTPISPPIADCFEGKVYCNVKGVSKGCITPDACANLLRESKPTTTKTTSTIKQDNPSAPVHCSVHPDCGGGTKPLTQAECVNSTCCQINGKMTFTKDKSICDGSIVRCSIEPNCGGGTREMTKQDCTRSVCCRINGTWEMRDKDTCSREQENERYNSWASFCKSITQDGKDYEGYSRCLNNYSE